ncbi:MAG: hypothetical protein NTX87_10380 [Planctomycetota bacterium]|nr:hypothetical protein [Planctomycetota bacterium]
MAGEDLTLRIGGDAQGATQALREAAAAVQQFQGQTMFGGAGVSDVSGQTAVLGENAAGIFVVQGLVAILKHLGEEAERETKRMLELGKTTTEAMGKLEEIQHRRGPLTGERTEEMRQRQLALMRAGVSEEGALKMLDVLDRRRPGMPIEELKELGYAWTGRTEDLAGRKAVQDPAVFARRFAQASVTRGMMAERGGYAVMQLPATREAALGATARTAAEAQRGTRGLLIRDYAAVYGVSVEEAEERISRTEETWNPFAVLRRAAFSQGEMIETAGRLRTHAAQLGLSRAVKDTGFTLPVVRITNVGTQLAVNFGTEPRDVAASGPVRGPSE